MRKITKELFLLLFMVLIAAMINSLVASQRMALVFYFLPTLYSAYNFGRRHATLTALFSVILVVLLTYLNPAGLTSRFGAAFWSLPAMPWARCMNGIRKACTN